MSEIEFKFALISWIISMVGIIIFFLHALYLRKKWLPQVEKIFRGYDLMSDHLFFAILACIQYGGAFTSTFLAKRSKMTDAREKVPPEMQRKFIFSFWIFTISSMIFIGVMLVVPIE